MSDAENGKEQEQKIDAGKNVYILLSVVSVCLILVSSVVLISLIYSSLNSRNNYVMSGKIILCFFSLLLVIVFIVVFAIMTAHILKIEKFTIKMNFLCELKESSKDKEIKLDNELIKKYCDTLLDI